jgi:hypothetical protein
VDLLFSERDGVRPSFMQIVRDSTNPEVKARILATLEERAEREHGGKINIKSESVHEEIVKV